MRVLADRIAYNILQILIENESDFTIGLRSTENIYISLQFIKISVGIIFSILLVSRVTHTLIGLENKIF